MATDTNKANPALTELLKSNPLEVGGLVLQDSEIVAGTSTKSGKEYYMVKTTVLCGGQPVFLVERKTADNPNPPTHRVGDVIRCKIRPDMEGTVKLDVVSLKGDRA